MAMQVEGTAVVKVDGQEAGKQIENLENKARQLRKEIIELKKQPLVDQKALKDKEAELRKLNAETKQLKQNTLDYQKVLKNLSGASINDLTKAYNKLQREVKSLDRTTEEYKRKTADMSKIKAEMAKVRQEMGMVGKSSEGMMGKMAGFIGKFGTMIVGAAAAFTGLLFSARKAVDIFNEFEAAQSNLQAITGLSKKEVEDLGDEASKMATSVEEGGIRITKSSKDIVDAFTSAGSKRPELLKNAEALKQVTKDALILSEAAKMELDPAITAVTAAMNQFGLGADESRRIINVFAAGSLAGSAEVGNLAESFKNVGTVAADSNLSLEQTVAALEVLGEKQIYSEEAGTKLRGALLKLKDAGVGYTSGQFNMRDALVEVNTMLEKQGSDAERDALKIKLFGAENVTVGTILTQNIQKYDELTVAVTDTNTAMEQAAINTDNNAAKLAQAQNVAEENAKTLGEYLAPALTTSTNAFNYLTKAIIMMIQYGEPVGKVFGFLKTTVSYFVDAVSELLIALGLLKKDSMDMTQIMRGIAIGFQIILAPTEAFVWVLTGLIKALKWSIELFESFDKTIKNLIPDSEAFSKIVDGIKIAFTLILGPIGAIIAAFKLLKTIWNSLADDPKSLVIIPKIDFAAINKAKEDAYQESIKKIAEFEEEADKKNAQLDAEERERRKKAYEDRLSDEKSLRKQIQQWTIEEMAEGKTKAEEELKVWRESEYQKIKESKASAKVKNEAVAALNLLYLKKQEDLDKKYNDDLLKELERQRNFIIENNAKIAKTREEMMADDIAAIEAKYDAEIKKAEENAAKDEKLKAYFAQVEIDLEKAKTDAIAAYKKKAEEDLAEHIFSVREEYGLVTDEEYYQNELDKLQKFHEDSLISEEDYLAAKAKINQEYHVKKLNEIASGIEQERQITSGFVQFFQTAKQMELDAAGDNAEKKKEIQKKYADTELAITIGKIWADTALAIIKLYTELPWIAATVAAVGMAALGGIQSAQAVEQRNMIKGLEGGGEFGVTREQDGKQFDAVYGGSKRGLISRPTVLVGENGPEYVIPNEGLRNPVIASIVGMIEESRRSKQLKSFNYDRVLPAMLAGNTMRGYAEGGFTQTNSSAPATPAQNANQDLMMAFGALASEIKTWKSTLKAVVSISDVEYASDLLNNTKSKVTL